MKRIRYNIKALAVISGMVLLLVLASCKKNFENINDDPNTPKDVPTAYLLTSGQKGLMDFTWDRWWNGSVGNMMAQYWAQNQYTDESQYQFRTSVTDNYWEYFYAGGFTDEEQYIGGLKELQEIIDRCNADPAKNSVSGDPNKQKAIATILQVWCYQNITDTWGDVPFSEALQDVRNTQPKYDKQEDIYMGLFAKLDSAEAWINLGSGADPSGDMIYNGDMGQWRKFMNSLKLRVAIRIADRNSSLASTKISEAVAGGVFGSNADNAVFRYIPGIPNVNPLHYDRIISGRQDFSASKVMVDLLLSLNDSLRIAAFYDTTRTPGLGFVGRPYGQNTANASTIRIADVSQPSENVVLAATAPGIYLDWAQVEFILAEAAARGYNIGGEAEEHYNRAINASFEFWTGAIAPNGYLENPNIKYSTLTTSGGKTWRQVIGQQKWIALYNQGIQGWAEYRRLDFGLLAPPVDGVLDGDGNIPLRMKYPVTEQTLNGKSYAAGVANQGPDRLETRLWWDIQ